MYFQYHFPSKNLFLVQSPRPLGLALVATRQGRADAPPSNIQPGYLGPGLLLDELRFDLESLSSPGLRAGESGGSGAWVD
ncbi:hypothetical protein D3C77_228730 [compost metagenome]